MNDLARLSLFDAARGIAAGSLSSEALVQACLERIGTREDKVGAWIHLDPEQALAEARARDREAPRGPLHGVPIGLKDIIDTADMPTGYGSPIYNGFRPARDAHCVAQLRGAGAVILGKTVTAEFATYHPGKTANPRGLGHTPGGSSSGSAAAVADFHAPCALGTQTAGSIIRPASFCGVIGYKPSFNAFDYDGLHPLAPSLDTLGVFVRSFADLAPLRQVLSLAPPSPVAGTAGARPPRIGFCRTGQWLRADPAMRAALEACAQDLARAGAELVEIDLAPVFTELVAAQTLIFSAEAVRGLDKEWREHAGLLSPELVALLEQGRRYTPAMEQDAQRLARQCRAELAAIFTTVDVLLTPSCLGEAPAGLGNTGDPLFNRIWTMLHVPCVTYPMGAGPLGLPLGAQVVGPHGDDDALIAHAGWMQQHGAPLPAVLDE
jgi:Asp-tRNA(Asn)/Glu-tRNA(Gln) amidotransferase A subunit family amidase